MYQVELINTAIDAAKRGTRLHGLPHVSDPSDEVVEILIKCMDWNIASRQSRIPETELADLHQKAVELLNLLQKNLPDKTGEKAGWNFEKAHTATQYSAQGSRDCIVGQFRQHLVSSTRG
jgi:hypothetical protein